MFFTNQVKNVNLVRGSLNNYFCKIILKSDQWLIFNDFFLSFSIGCHGKTEFFMNFNSFSYFKKGPPKDHPEKFERYRTIYSGRDVIILPYTYRENQPRPLAAMFVYESCQKCQFTKRVTQQLFL